MTDNNQVPADPMPGERIRIPVDTPPSEPNRKNESVDELVREYESKYYGFREDEAAKAKARLSSFLHDLPPKRKRGFTVSKANVTEDERMWAAIAHGSALLTLIVGILTGGIATLFTLFVPLGIYFAYRQRSEYVAYAALQAFALQVLGTVGWVAILVTGLLAGALLTVLLAITIVGVLLVPFVALAIIIFALASFLLPLGMVVYGAIASWETYQGKWYRYPWIGDWVDRQMHAGFLATL